MDFSNIIEDIYLISYNSSYYILFEGAGMIKPLYLRDQFRLPPCMSPRQIKKQRAGFVNDYFGEPKLTKDTVVSLLL